MSVAFAYEYSILPYMQNTKTKNQKHHNIEYPIRLNRYLYLTGVCSRRAADRLIAQHEVFVNNKVATLGQKVHKGDFVSLGAQAKKLKNSYKYYLYHKPVGVVSHNPQRDETDAVTDAGLPHEFAPVGRLDKASQGLMLLTNDGRIVHKLLNPDFHHTKTYTVTLDKPIKNHHIKIMQNGVNIEGYITQPAHIIKKNDTTLSMKLTEGKKHQIRRMCAALGYQVRILKRTAILHLKLSGLAPDEKRELTEKELHALFATLGMVV